jgi:predicted Zn-ribbon and HTH transcriptional regulator
MTTEGKIMVGDDLILIKIVDGKIYRRDRFKPLFCKKCQDGGEQVQLRLDKYNAKCPKCKKEHYIIYTIDKFCCKKNVPRERRRAAI